MIHEDIVTFKQAKILKELGFDEKTLSVYCKIDEACVIPNPKYWPGKSWHEFSAPTLAQVKNWLLEQKKVYIEIYDGDYLNHFGYELKFDWADNHRYCCQGYRTPSQALSAGIDAALKYIKDRDER